eukprot:1329289-Lingulodinium_polyedra.AAC.1
MWTAPTSSAPPSATPTPRTWPCRRRSRTSPWATSLRPRARWRRSASTPTSATGGWCGASQPTFG